MSYLDTKECAICLEDIYLELELPCKHKFCFMCIKQNIEISSTCPMCRKKFSSNILEKSSTKQLEENIKWMYRGRNNGWWCYTTYLNLQIEQRYQKYQKTLDISIREFQCEILGREYTINFDKMTQDCDGNIRDIKRIEDAVSDEDLVKGISGMRFS